MSPSKTSNGLWPPPPIRRRHIPSPNGRGLGRSFYLSARRVEPRSGGEVDNKTPKILRYTQNNKQIHPLPFLY